MSPIKLFFFFFVTTFDRPERSPEKQPLLGSTSSRRAQLLWLSLGGVSHGFLGEKICQNTWGTTGGFFVGGLEVDGING